MSKREKLLIVSPHFDDAVLSCGGRMCSKEWENSDISIVNVFSEIFIGKEMLSDVIIKYMAEDMSISHNNINQKTCEKWIHERKKEEVNATYVLRVNSFNLGYIDAIFRMFNNQYIYNTEEKLFLGQERERVLLEQLINQFSNICKYYSKCYFPAGIGNHPDHILLHQVGKEMQRRNVKVGFYCELPYTIDNDILEGKRYEIDEENNYKKKIRAVSEYRTQLNWLLRKGDNLETLIPRYEIYY